MGCTVHPLANKLANRGVNVAGFMGGALPDTNVFATICSHVHVADKLSGSELKSGVWVAYNHIK